MSLREATRQILDSDRPAEWLRLADLYMNTYNQMPETFVLPAQHAMLKPVIDTFKSDLERFVLYVQAIRDQYGPGEKRVELQKLYRTILVRQMQQSRRSRVGRALKVVETMLNRGLGPDERERVSRKLDQHWARRRQLYLEGARRGTDKGRLSSDERSELLNEFWAEVDAEIDRRELPMFKL